MNISVILDDFTKESKEFLMTSLVMSEHALVSDIKRIYEVSNEIDIHFIYRGEVVNDSLSLKELGIKDGSCIKLLFKKSKPKFIVENFEDSVNEIVRKHKEIMRTKSKEMINKIILEVIDNIIETHPELESDIVAYSIAYDYHLLRTLFSSRENVYRILENHPVLIPAALETLNIINEKFKLLSAKQTGNDVRYYSLQELEQSDSSSSEEEQPSSSQTQSESISRLQLRQAMDSISSSSRPQPARISLSQLRNAVQTALHEQIEPMEVDSIPSSTASASFPTSDSLERKLAQLHSMGFIDKEANKIALEASGGDVEAAIEYLIM